MTMRMILRTVLAAASAAALSGAANAATGGAAEYKHNHWHFSGPFGSYDKEAVQRGFQVYKTVCASCHAVEQLSFRNLGDKATESDIWDTIMSIDVNEIETRIQLELPS